MNKNRKEWPKSKVQQLIAFVEEMELLLHPNVITAWKKLVWDARTEMAQAAKDQVFSKEMQELEPLLEYYRRDIILFTKGGASAKHLWHFRPIMQKIIELYGRQDPDV